jgi:hypothetical protein
MLFIAIVSIQNDESLTYFFRDGGKRCTVHLNGSFSCPSFLFMRPTLFIEKEEKNNTSGQPASSH